LGVELGLAIEFNTLEYIFDPMFKRPAIGLIQCVLEGVEPLGDCCILRMFRQFVEKVVILCDRLGRFPKARCDHFKNAAVDVVGYFLIEFSYSKVRRGFHFPAVGFDFAIDDAEQGRFSLAVSTQ
jgi:hypothetical protein